MRSEDEQHLNLLSIFYYVLGGLTFLGCLVALLYVVMGSMFYAMPMPPPTTARGAPQPPPPEFFQMFGTMFIIVGLIMGLICAVQGACNIAAGVCLSRRKHYTYCLVIAALACLGFPLGTILGVFSFIVLLRPSVKQLFEMSGLPAALAEGDDYHVRSDYR